MFELRRFLNREAAAEYLTAQGIEITAARLADLAYRGRGPEFSKPRGRAVYTREQLEAWIAQEVARTVNRRRRGDRQQSAA